MSDTLALYLLAVPAVVLFGLSKGGFSGISMLGTPMIALAVGPTRAAAIVLPILIVQDALGMIMFRAHVERAILTVMLPGAVAGVTLAYLLARSVPQPAVEIVLGAISLGFAALKVRPEQKRAPLPLAIDRALGVAGGLASGFTSMVAHAGVPPFQLYVLPKNLNRDRYIGTSIVFFAATNWCKILPFALLGQFTHANLFVSATLLPLALASTWAGAKLVRRVDPRRFFVVIRVLLAFTGVMLMVNGIGGLNAR